MSNVSLLDGSRFDCIKDETILEGALRNNIVLEYSCKDGRCKSCMTQLISGVTSLNAVEYSLTDKEKELGYILTCLRKPLTDIYIKAENLAKYNLSKPSITAARIIAIDKLNEGVLLVRLRFPPAFILDFQPGQFLDLIIGSIKRSYSIASAPENENIELIVKIYPNGAMSSYLQNEAKENDLVRVEVPKGTFFLRENKGLTNLILLANGTGIASFKSILSSSKSQSIFKTFSKVVLLWGIKTPDDQFWDPDFDFLEFHPVYSRASKKYIYVQDYLEKLDLDMSESVIYACGSNSMIAEARTLAIGNGLIPDNFYSDIFLPTN
jgi:CDP-4-dehydro-6-deoxyglucose reductase, E3